jgi:hypothetical protein
MLHEVGKRKHSGNVPACSLSIGGSGQLDLDPIDAVHAIDEEDEDEYKGYL